MDREQAQVPTVFILFCFGQRQLIQLFILLTCLMLTAIPELNCNETYHGWWSTGCYQILPACLSAQAWEICTFCSPLGYQVMCSVLANDVGVAGYPFHSEH